MVAGASEVTTVRCVSRSRLDGQPETHILCRRLRRFYGAVGQPIVRYVRLRRRSKAALALALDDRSAHRRSRK